MKIILGLCAALGTSAAWAASKDETELRRSCKGLAQRISAHDLPGVRSYMAPGVRVTSVRGRTAKDQQVLRSMQQTFIRYPKFRTELNVDKVVVRGDKAYLTAGYENRGIQKKAERGRCNMVWKRLNGRWRLALLSRG